MEYFFKFKKTLNSQLSRLAARLALASRSGSMRAKRATLNSEGGQALLVIVLIMVVGLTVGLAVASRSITNIRTSTEEENSQRAFSAAEAGIEKVLKTGASSSLSNIGNNSGFDTKITFVSGAEILLNGANPVPKDEGIDIWLVNHDSNGQPDYSNPQVNGNIFINWGTKADPCDDAALEVVLVKGPVSAPETERYTYDKCNTRRDSNKFSPGDAGAGDPIEGKNFSFKTTPIGVTGALIVRIVPIYYSAPIGAEVIGGGDTFPPQGKKIESTGTSGQTQRKINYIQGYPALPVELFPNILFSPK